MDRTLHAEGLRNARDLGGLPRADGSTTPAGVFFRAANADHVTAAGWRAVHAAGIRTVVDLRQQDERDRDVGPRPGWLTTVAVDLDGLEHADFWAHYWENGLVGTALYFRPHLEALPERTVAVLSALAGAPPGGVLFHCMGGRDRTGMIAMVLLVAAGVTTDAVVDDYLETVRVGVGEAAIPGVDEAAVDALCAAHGTTTEGAFRTALDGFDPAPLLAALTPAEREALRTWRGALA